MRSIEPFAIATQAERTDPHDPEDRTTENKILALQSETAQLVDELAEELKNITVASIIGSALAVGVSASQPKPRKPAAERKPRSEGLPARLLAEINTSPALSFSAEELVGLLKIDRDKVGQVRNALIRMLKQGKISSYGVGTYCAKDAK